MDPRVPHLCLVNYLITSFFEIMKKLKTTMWTWLIVYLLITGILYALQTWLTPLPIYVRTLILSALMVFSLQYVVLPGIEKIRQHYH